MADSKIPVAQIKKLRELTGVGMQDAQKALSETGGDLAKAQGLLRKQGIAKAAKKSSRTAKQGLIESYVHKGKFGVLVEVNCETDFVAKTQDFKYFIHELALQIAATAPQYISRSDVPESVIEQEKSIISEQARTEGKPEAVVEKMVLGKLEKFLEEVCLLEQPSIKDPKVKVNQMLTDLVNKLGENVTIARFVRYQLGEETSVD